MMNKQEAVTVAGAAGAVDRVVSTWYARREGVARGVLLTLGVDPILFESLSQKIHVDDFCELAKCFDVSVEILRDVLYSPCCAPGGVRIGVVC